MGNTYDVPKTEIVTVFDIVFIPQDKKTYQHKYLVRRCYSKQEAENSKNINYAINKKDGSSIKINDVKGELVIKESNELFYK